MQFSDIGLCLIPIRVLLGDIKRAIFTIVNICLNRTNKTYALSVCINLFERK